MDTLCQPRLDRSAAACTIPETCFGLNPHDKAQTAFLRPFQERLKMRYARMLEKTKPVIKGGKIFNNPAAAVPV